MPDSVRPPVRVVSRVADLSEPVLARGAREQVVGRRRGFRHPLEAVGKEAVGFRRHGAVERLATEVGG